MDLGFAGRRGAHHPTHRAIGALSAGPRAGYAGHVNGGRWELLDISGNTVGRLAASFKPPPGMRCRSAAVLAVVARSRESSDPKYHAMLRCDSWEVVVPELVFEPAEV